MVRATTLLALASLFVANFVAAHPGGDRESAHELNARSEYLAATAADVANCENSPEYAAVREAAIKRRSEFLAQLRRRANVRRSVADALSDKHQSNLTGLTSSTDPAKLFGTSPKCILSPETTEGPYFIAGEPIRNNIVDGQSGLPLYVDLQFVDSKTCKVIPNLYINFWHCNSTGVYSGVVAGGNGNSGDKNNIYRNNHRGIYPTNSEGVVQFTTTFPGHYTGRATHIHLATASGGTVLANNTYSKAVYSHVGQLFFDQSLITAVTKLSPYNTNTQTLTTNAKDGILAQAAAGLYDPTATYAYVSDNINNGILAWLSVAVDTSKVINVAAARWYTPGTASASDNVLTVNN